MTDITNNFLNGSMNKDLDESLVPNGSYRDALNVDIMHSEGDDSGAVRNKKGNTRVGDALNTLGNVTGRVTTTARTIGATTYEADNLIYYLVTADTFDGVFEYNESTDTVSRVLQSNKTSPSSVSQLNFNKDYYVTGINFIDGFLYWTDDFNPPRRINVSRARAYNIDDARIDNDISVILAPPLYAPYIDMVNEQDKENNMKEKFVQFSYRFRYIDNQYSAMAPFSGIAFSPGTFILDFGAGENKGMLNTQNQVDITFRTGGEFVVGVDLIMRDTKSMNIYIVESFNKGDLDINNDSVYTYNFSNSKIYRTLPTNQLTRLYDNVPLKAKAQELIDRRIVYGNYEQSYDIADDMGVNIMVDYNVAHVSKNTEEKIPIQTFRSDRDYEIGIQYGDEFGRFSTILTSPVLKSTVYIPAANSITGNSITVCVNNKPPEFAKKYRLAIKQSRGKYYNIFPTLHYGSGMYRYFKVNEFDRDKIRVGEYLIFKADFSGPTLSNKRYKILEFEQKPQNFLGINTVSGLYFKVKVDSSSELNPAFQFTHEYTSNGVGSNIYGVPSDMGYPVTERYAVAEKPIHYGTGPSSILSVVGNIFNSISSNPSLGDVGDLRLTIEIINQTEFRYTFDLAALTQGWYTKNIMAGSQVDITYLGLVVVKIEISAQSFYQAGDRWKISCRSGGHLTGNYFGGVGIPTPGIATLPYMFMGSAVVPGPSFSQGIGQETDMAIEVGAEITIGVNNFNGGDIVPSPFNVPIFTPNVFPPSENRYENIEEWFIESGAYLQFINPATVSEYRHSKAITFRRGVMETPAFYGLIFGGYPISQGGANFDFGVPGTDVGLTATTLNYPVKMIISGGHVMTSMNLDPTAPDVPEENKVQVKIEIKQNANTSQCETVAIDTDSDIYHETSRTYPIVNGMHKVLWDYQNFSSSSHTDIFGDQYTNLGQLTPGSNPSGLEPHFFQVGDVVEVTTSTSPFASIPGAHTILFVDDKYNIVIDLLYPGAGAITSGSIGSYHLDMEERNQTFTQGADILINSTSNTNSTYNAYAFGNGLESDRIRDEFNGTTIEYSPRASTTIEGYGKNRKASSLTYSGTYRDKTSTNSLNEFNASLVNFKNLDVEFGSVQKIHARDTDLLVFQEDKISRVLYGKNLLSDAIGGGTVTTSPEVLGTQISDKGEWGISFNPESFAEWANNFYWTDSRRGTVLSMKSEGIQPISSLGMKSYFRNLMKDSPNTQKLGVFDPNTESYVIASNNNTSRPCSLTLSKYGGEYPSGNRDYEVSFGKYVFDFAVYSNTSWTAAIVYSAGSGWVNGWPASGFGDESIDLHIANNTTNAVRTATITFTFCNSLTVTYVVTQAPGENITVHPWVLTNKD